MNTRVIFDLAGVVFQWRPRQVLAQLLPHRIQSEAHAAYWAQQLFQSFEPHGDWALFDLGRIEPPALAQRIAQRTGLTEDEVHTVIEGIPPQLTPMEGTVRMVQDLHRRGTPLYFLSNMPAPYAERLVRDNPFFSLFRDGIFSAHVAQIKPERPIFEHATRRFDAVGPSTVFIDDTLPNIEMARDHGWQAVHFEDPAQCRAALQALGVLD